MPDPKPHILVVDDDDRLRALLARFLSEQGFMATVAADAAEARRKLSWFLFDLVILDVMMPGENGLQFLASLEEHRMPVLMLSAMGDSDDRINGLEAGAEDYLAKPFEPKELVLRVKALLKRSGAQKDKTNIVAFGDYRFDLGTNQLKRGQHMIALTSNEALMLRLLAENAGKTVERETLAKAMPGAGNERTVDVQITRLRKKIEASERKPIYLQTVRGAGYVLHAE